MSWPVTYPVEEGDLKRGLVSPSIGGHTFYCSATCPAAGIVPRDFINVALEKICAFIGPFSRCTDYVFTRRVKIPSQTGIMYLDIGGVNCLTAGVTAISNAELVGLSIRVEAPDATRDYDVEVILDPGGADTLLGSLSLSNALSNFRDDLSALITAGNEWGVRIRRTSGSGRSTFTNMVVAVRVRN
jgi:hypothetical protein